MAMSILIFAGAAQFIGLELFKNMIPGWEIIIATFVINLRMAIYSFSFLPRVKDFSFIKKFFLLIGLTDENYVLFSLNSNKTFNYYQLLFIIILCYLGWNFGTFVGIYFLQEIPHYIDANIYFLYYLLFVILLIESIFNNKKYLLLVLITIGLNFLFSIWVESFLRVILASLVGGGIFVGLSRKKLKKA